MRSTSQRSCPEGSYETLNKIKTKQNHFPAFGLELLQEGTSFNIMSVRTVALPEGEGLSFPALFPEGQKIGVRVHGCQKHAVLPFSLPYSVQTLLINHDSVSLFDSLRLLVYTVFPEATGNDQS